MIQPDLHTNLVPLDREQHKLLRFRREGHDNEHFTRLNSCFVLAGEFTEACKEYPLLWIPAGQGADGLREVAPIAVFGIARQSNLCLDRGAWRTQYMPALLRMYPFAIARASESLWTVCYDASSPRFSLTEGESLFGADGQPSAFTLDLQKQLEQLETEVERTRRAGRELLQRDLLQEMRFEVALSDGSKVAVDGFLTIDEERFGQLSDADVVTMHKNGLMALIHAHHVSLSNMRRLANWHAERAGLSAVPAQPPG
jgi:SapC